MVILVVILECQGVLSQKSDLPKKSFFKFRKWYNFGILEVLVPTLEIVSDTTVYLEINFQVPRITKKLLF